ncbi:ArdC family protein [Bacillus licheniformis]|jgi:antirestriction protein ArdC|uniref:ArdC family protein n=1 Tax=Bacillus licheniformis TaxID=1402 RepID=UPI0009292C9A|nr:zincin-like metallopeptidase domain-containing protein [Bacillus licheniformis]OJT66897.1 antirestriction protein [Bacillus licheniformis]
MKKNVYEIITERIINQLEKGVVPWRKPWNNNGIAVNWKTQKAYRGINAFIMEPGEYATMKQILKAGGRIKREEMKNFHIVVYWLWIDNEEEETDEKKKFAVPLYYKVWEINQCTGIESKRKDETYQHNPIKKAEDIFNGYINSPDYTFNSGRAVYYPVIDKINCPPLKDFKVPEEYYSTLFHEMVHSTGHKSRLARPGVTSQNVAFGDPVYSKEELIAEMGAAMLCGVAGIFNHTIENSASYIASWMKAIKKDHKLVLQASAQAQKAADYILGVKNQD